MFTKSPVIFTSFQNIKDTRRQGANLRHSVYEIIVLALCASIANSNTWVDIERFGIIHINWFKRFLRLEHGIPSHDTIGKVFAALDTNSFAACLNDWIERLQLDLKGKGVHIDGKVARRSFDAATNQSALHLVSAWCNELSISLGQVSTDEKSNEITAIPKLLELLNLEGAVVTMDALNCQAKTIAKIRDRKADYVVTVKGNQPKLQETIQNVFNDFGELNYKDPRCHSHKTTCTTRGRIEERIVYVTAAPRELKDSGKWADIKTIGMVYRHREADPKSESSTPVPETDFVTYFISSLPPKPKEISKHVRDHWTVENQLHWSLDVNFTEDASRIRKGNGQEIMGSLRRLVLSILKRDTSLPKESLRGKRLIASWSIEALEAIITGL